MCSAHGTKESPQRGFETIVRLCTPCSREKSGIVDGGMKKQQEEKRSDKSSLFTLARLVPFPHGF